MKALRLLIPTLTFSLLTACATTTETPLLAQARDEYSAAQSNPQVVNLAAGELNQAQEALGRANEAANKGEDAAKVDHLAYLAKQRAAIAREVSRQKTSEQAVANASAERNRIRLAARTREAESAGQAAQSAQEEAQRAQQRAEAAEKQLQELQAKKTERGIVITLGDVLFDTNQAQIKPGGKRIVQKAAEVLKQYPERTVSVEGFTDSTGSESRNEELSRQRAEAVRGALVEDGVNPAHITIAGYGAAFPVAGNDSPGGRQMNRRVEIVVSSQAGEPVTPR
jgi:outer membrane protein OmpA-like peptidoglycan-associated protein